MSRKAQSLIERIINGYRSQGDCWIWQGRQAKNGYGQFGLRVNGKLKMKLPHRVAYEAFKGEIPKGLVVDHLCRNTMCVNPDHLEAVTQKVNVLRGKGVAAANAQKDHCINGHAFTLANTYFRKDKYSRDCRTCRNAASRRAIA